MAGSATILAVDDNPLTRCVIRAALESHGYAVVEAVDGTSALARARERIPDLVVQDLQLPDCGGGEFLRRLRALPGGANLPVVALSGAHERRGVDADSDQRNLLQIHLRMRGFEVTEAGDAQQALRLMRPFTTEEVHGLVLLDASWERDLTNPTLPATTDAIVTFDQQGRVVSWNGGAQLMTGYDAEEVVGRPVLDLLTVESREAWRRALEESDPMATRDLAAHQELQGLRKDGSNFPLELCISSYESGQGRFFTAIARDITGRKELERQLLHAQKMEALGQLCGGVAHDFNNLLTAISGYAELLLQDGRGHQGGAAAAPGHRRGRGAARRAALGGWPREGRPGAARAGHLEPGGQRARRHAAGWAPAHPQRRRGPAPAAASRDCDRSGRPVGPAARERHRPGHGRVGAAPHLRAFLHHLGARQGNRACSESGPIHMLLTDTVMPIMGGRQLAERVVGQRPETAVLYMSGYTNDAVLRHGVLTDQVAFVQKPFRSQELLLRVRAILDGAPAEGSPHDHRSE